jgi:nitrite reductase/ring-hydroxylating ferredoxin subunit
LTTTASTTQGKAEAISPRLIGLLARSAGGLATSLTAGKNVAALPQSAACRRRKLGGSFGSWAGRGAFARLPQKSHLREVHYGRAEYEFSACRSLEELKAKGRLVLHGAHRPILVVYDRGRVFALDNRCPHMGFPLEDGILTCHWHHARFDLESGCTFDLWADDAPTFPVKVRNDEVWIKTTFSHADSAMHWRRRLNDGLEHDIGLVIARRCKAGSRSAHRNPTS